MVEETLVVGSSVARVARKHGVNANQVFQGRRLYKGGRLGGQPGIGLKLLPVRVAEEVEQVEAPVPGAAAGWIHIELPRGVRISLAGAVDPVLIGAVLKGLCP